MSDVLRFTGETRIPDTAADALEKAKGWDMERVVIIGWKDGGEFVFGGSHSEIGEAVLLCQLAIKRLVDHADTP